VPYRKPKKPHNGIGTAVGAMCPIAPNTLWAMDFQFDTTVDGRTLKLLNIVDEFTRERPAIVVDRSIDADRVVTTLDRLKLTRGARRSSASTTARNSSRRRSRTGAGSTASAPASSTPDRPGRTPGSSRSTAGSAPSSSTPGSSTASAKPRCSSRTGGSTATSTNPTAPMASSPRASSPTPGPPDTNQHSHSARTSQRGPLSGTTGGIVRDSVDDAIGEVRRPEDVIGVDVGRGEVAVLGDPTVAADSVTGGGRGSGRSGRKARRGGSPA
jgi:hypothetical protein